MNDAHGHALGDGVLQTTASRLRTAVRDGDVVARLGGDEFVVIAEPVNEFDEASVLGARLVQTLEQPFRLAETTVSISASVGVALNLDPEIDALGMLRDADVAVYEAKARGKGRVEAFDAALSDRLLEQASLDQDLRQAIAIDEFVVHYQPIMALDTGRPTALEALVRWERPGQGITLPSVFLPVAEASGLIVELDQLVLTKVLAQLSSWAEHPVLADVAVALNVSGRGLASTTLLERVDRGLASFGVRPDRLIIEVTESHLLGDLPRGTAQLEGLRQRGVRVALDDFGMGYASITHLRQLPVDMVKIDRSLVADLGDERGRPLTELVVQAAGAMGLDVVAKGVETSGQLDTIRDLRCDFAQGFLFSEPRPAADIEAWMTANLDDTAP